MRARADVTLISIVDDDAAVRRTTAWLVESFSFRAAPFECGESFLRCGQLDGTSCLVVDMQMPGMNGLQLQAHLTAAGYRIPIIVLTSYGKSYWRQPAMQADAVAFLENPFCDELL